jgi:hypothetical protein
MANKNRRKQRRAPRLESEPREPGTKPKWLKTAIAILRDEDDPDQKLREFWDSMPVRQRQELDLWLLKVNHKLATIASAPIDRFRAITADLAKE